MNRKRTIAKLAANIEAPNTEGKVRPASINSLATFILGDNAVPKDIADDDETMGELSKRCVQAALGSPSNAAIDSVELLLGFFICKKNANDIR